MSKKPTARAMPSVEEEVLYKLENGERIAMTKEEADAHRASAPPPLNEGPTDAGSRSD